MKALFDTHALSWWLEDDYRLGERVSAFVKDPKNTLLVSAVTAFEMATKFRIGKWPEIGPLVEFFDQAIRDEGFDFLHVTAQHSLLAGGFKAAHRDPFDRLLAAQAIIEKCPIISGDPAMKILGADVIW